MKKLKLIISLFVLTFVLGCSNDTGDINVDAVGAPTNISALTTVTQDNTGRVTFVPRGEGVTRYEIYFGDATV
ncbi:MAG: hypothetical protein PSX42_02455, partial [bacterium]|nr:hypothetical protein [bacterium]